VRMVQVMIAFTASRDFTVTGDDSHSNVHWYCKGRSKPAICDILLPTSFEKSSRSRRPAATKNNGVGRILWLLLISPVIN
jgi:hypothetical protein